MEIERQVRLDAAPMRVAAALAASPWRSAMRIEPAGAGSRVLIAAEVVPDGLAHSVEALALAEVCDLRSQLAQPVPSAAPDPRNSLSHSPNQTRRRASPRTATPNPRRTTMTTIDLSITIDAPADDVWKELADFGAVSVWNPNVKQSRLTSEAGEGTGISRECVLAPMGTVQERVTEWTEGRLMGIEIYDHKNLPALRSAFATIELEPLGSATAVRVQMDYTVGLGFVGAGMNAMGMKRLFTKSLGGLLAGLKHRVETGEAVDGKTSLDLAAVQHAA